MARAASAEVREAVLQALLRTASSQVLAQLTGSGRTLDTLEFWAKWARSPPSATPSVLQCILSEKERGWHAQKRWAAHLGEYIADTMLESILVAMLSTQRL